MPKISSRNRQIKSINSMLELLLSEDNANLNKTKVTDQLEKEIDELFELLQVIELDRYLTSREKTIKSNDFFQTLLLNYNDYNFKQITRVSKETFWYIEGLIHNNPGFSNKSKILQRPVWQQLAVTLERLGCNGNGASVERFARQWGLGIGIVIKYTKRVSETENTKKVNRFQKTLKQRPNFRATVWF